MHLDDIAETLGLAPVSDEARDRLEPLFALAIAVWGSEDEARAFFLRRHPLMGDDTPLRVALGSEEGARLVKRTLGRLQHGTAS